VGLPVPQNRQLTIDCLAAVSFGAAGSSPAQSNWTGAAFTVPAGASIDWMGNNGGWRAARFTQSDYVSPNGDGSVTLRSQSGDISLHPAGTGVVRILSDAESTGAVELIGRGSPLNAVSAPAGSTFRNLNGRNRINQLGCRGLTPNIGAKHDNDCTIAAGGHRWPDRFVTA
jgi:hypothetical protein